MPVSVCSHGGSVKLAKQLGQNCARPPHLRKGDYLRRRCTMVLKLPCWGEPIPFEPLPPL